MTQTTLNFDAPPREKSDAERFDGQREAILKRLQQGPALNTELGAFCLNPRARISELRKRGYVIKCVFGKGGLNTYQLVTDE